MKAKQKLYSGGRKTREGERQSEAHTGRKQNQSAKTEFRSGGVQGSQRTDAKHRAAVLRGKKAASDE
jgi:hypothetical protein